MGGEATRVERRIRTFCCSRPTWAADTSVRPGATKESRKSAFDYAFLLSRILTNDRPRSSSTVSPDDAASSSVNAPQLTPAQEKVQQALTGCRVVEYVAHQRCLRCLVDKVPQTRRSGLQALQEERVHRGISRWKLAGMQIPALVVAVRERALDQIEMMPHGSMHDRAILRGLVRR